MKKLILLLMVLGAVVISASAQEVKKEKEEKSKDIDQKDVPAAVVAKLNSLYPSTDDLEWEMKGGNYKAEFEVNKVETWVLFTPAGEVMETKTVIDASELPEAVKTYMKDHPGNKIKKAKKVVAADGKITYIVESGDDDIRDLMFDASGNYIGEKGSKKKHKVQTPRE